MATGPWSVEQLDRMRGEGDPLADSTVKAVFDKGTVGAVNELLTKLEREHSADFRNAFIAESPAKLRRIRDYFAALCGQREFPPVRCNAPEFSAVVNVDGRVAPCFFIPAPADAPRAPHLSEALDSEPMRALRAAIRAGERPECAKCVCSMWRDPATLAHESFRQRVARDA